MPYSTVQTEPQGGLHTSPHPLFHTFGIPRAPRYHYPTRIDNCRDLVICVPRYRVTFPRISEHIGSTPRSVYPSVPSGRRWRCTSDQGAVGRPLPEAIAPVGTVYNHSVGHTATRFSTVATPISSLRGFAFPEVG